MELYSSSNNIDDLQVRDKLFSSNWWVACTMVNTERFRKTKGC